VRFAPHVLGRDEHGQHVGFAFEYGGLTLGRAHRVCFAAHRLRCLKPTDDPWRSGSLESRPQVDLRDIEAAVGSCSTRPPRRSSKTLEGVNWQAEVPPVLTGHRP